MVPQILTRGQLEKMSNENLIAPCLALQDNIILQQNDVTTKQGHIEKSIGNNIQNWFVSKEKLRVNKSCFSGTECLKNFAGGFQDYE